jgi:hypothetical protein
MAIHLNLIKERRKDNNTLHGVILSDATFKEKLEAVREANPLFYLLTPTPKKGK